LHVQVDPPPHVLDDEIGLRLAAPDGDWRARPDMDVDATRGFRASVVARARFIEDLVVEQAARGVGQYVLLGAGLDTFAQRRPDVETRIFEIDQPGTQAWKRKRLTDLGYGAAGWPRFVPVDFEARESWPQRLAAAGFDASQPAVVAATGVAMYLTRDAIADMLREIAALAPGSTLAMTFLLPFDLIDPEDRPGAQASLNGAEASGTPFVSLLAPDEMLALARDAGFHHARHLPTTELAERYFTGRSDGLRPSSGEAFLLATTSSDQEAGPRPR
jgi:methyltransferase (TIGR00027 family)